MSRQDAIKELSKQMDRIESVKDNLQSTVDELEEAYDALDGMHAELEGLSPKFDADDLQAIIDGLEDSNDGTDVWIDSGDEMLSFDMDSVTGPLNDLVEAMREIESNFEEEEEKE